METGFIYCIRQRRFVLFLHLSSANFGPWSHFSSIITTKNHMQTFPANHVRQADKPAQNSRQQEKLRVWLRSKWWTWIGQDSHVALCLLGDKDKTIAIMLAVTT